MVIVLYDANAFKSKYLLLDTASRTNGAWYSTLEEALESPFNNRWEPNDYLDYTLEDFIKRFSQYEVYEYNPTPLPYEYW